MHTTPPCSRRNLRRTCGFAGAGAALSMIRSAPLMLTAVQWMTGTRLPRRAMVLMSTAVVILPFLVSLVIPTSGCGQGVYAPATWRT